MTATPGSATSSDQRGALGLVIAFFITSLVSFIGMRWNMQATQWAFPLGTKVMLVAAFLIAALLCLFGRTSVAPASLTVAGAVPVGALAAELPQMIGDPTSNNLWPVGLVVLGVFALGVAFAGALVGTLASRAVKGLT